MRTSPLCVVRPWNPVGPHDVVVVVVSMVSCRWVVGAPFSLGHGILFESIRPAGLLIDLDTADDLKKCQRREKGFLGNVGII